MDVSLLPSFIIVAAILFVVWLLFSRRGMLFAFSSFSKGQLTAWQNALLFVCSFALFITVWGFLSRLEPEGINKIPGPGQTLVAAGHLLASGMLLSEAGISCLRVLIGFTAASAIPKNNVTC